MNRPLIVIFLIVLSLLAAVFVYEFALGLQHYESFKANDVLAMVTTQSREGPGDAIYLEVRALPRLDGLKKLMIPARLGPVTLQFDCLHSGSLGNLLGLKTSSKLAKISYVNHSGETVQHPVNGGTDLCFQFLELSGTLGSLIATPKKLEVILVAGSEGWRREAVYDGKSLYERDPLSI